MAKQLWIGLTDELEARWSAHMASLSEVGIKDSVEARKAFAFYLDHIEAEKARKEVAANEPGKQ